MWGVEDELQKLQRTFFKIQDLVDHVDGNSLRLYRGSMAWQLLFEKLRKLAYDADALLDHISLHLSTYCAHHSVASNQEKQVRPMVLSSFRELNLPHEIAEMQKKLDDLAKEMESLVMIEKAKFDANVISGRSPQMSSFYSKEPSLVVERTMVGRSKDKESIVNLVSKKCDSSSSFSVISIMGMCGIGKTAVARLVYDECSFDKKIWVSVSVDFDAIKITKSIIEFATLCACNLSDLGSLQYMLQGILQGSKFLLVLDDYWSEKCHDWDILSGPFRSGCQGSKVIVTTRNTKVSSIVCSHEAYILEILSDEDCWEVIKQRAMMSVESSRNLESVGMQIAKKCKGVPLVATKLGNMLRCKSTEEEWRFVLESELWDMPQGNNIFLHLMQSYVYLPTHLQKCFAYCSIFPQGYEFEMEELIFLWVAEGYVQPIGPQRFEGLVGRDYFNDLYLRFFFHQCRTASNQIRYKMHDLIHGMARLVSKDICFHAKHDHSNCYPLFGNACHLSLLHDGVQPLELEASVKNERLRTFLLMSRNSSSAILDPQLFSYLKFLRVLGLGGAGLTELVDSIEQLKYLRYLNLSDNPISRLPKSVCKIVALQILKLRSCPHLRDLPEEMSNLINLRHLEFDERMFTHMPPHFRKLTNLQYLSAYTVGRKNGCGIGELKSLNCLGGRLCIRKIDVSNASEATEAKLDLKKYLDKLELEWTFMGRRDSQKRLEQAEVLAELRPHINLKELVVKSYFGMKYPPWLSDPSHMFTSIHLKGLKFCNHLPSLGELPYLTSFFISDMPCLELIDNKFYGARNAAKFPSLRSFQLHGLSRLTHWEDSNGIDNVMPCLDSFTLHDCPDLSRLPQKLQSLLPISNVSGCPKLQP